MNSSTENKDFLPEENLPTTGDAPPKVVKNRVPALGTGVLLTGGAIVGCFALAFWNRKALSALVLHRGKRKDLDEDGAEDETDAIY